MSTKDEALELLKIGFNSISQICMTVLDRNEQLEQLVKDYHRLVTSDQLCAQIEEGGIVHVDWFVERDALVQRTKKLLEDEA